jgi:exodeoxyribonuclease V alpha subunit
MTSQADSTTISIVISTVHPGSRGGAIFTGKDSAGKWVRVVAAQDRIPHVPHTGDVWRLTGHYERHDVFGIQLHVEKATACTPIGRLMSIYLTTHPSFRGIGFGKAKAARLIHKFGESLTALLDTGDIEALSAVITEQVACRLVDAWQITKEEASVITFLDKHRMDARLANKVVRFWPKDAIEKLKENPYRLLHLANWREVDRFALSLGLTANDPRRLVAAVEAALYYRLDNFKDTLTCHAILVKEIAGLLQVSVKASVVQQAIDLALTEGAISNSAAGAYQPVGCAVMEKFIANRIGQMMEGKEKQLPLFSGNAIASAVVTCIAEHEREVAITLNVEQRAAVYMAVAEPLCVVTGGAGVGKTTVLSVIHRATETLGGMVVQMALAGRAAHRMREATGRESFTICGFLNNMKLGTIRLKSNALIIIDEASMLDLPLLYRILRVLPDDARLLLVGDFNQLPPIGFGLTFHIIASSKVVPVQHLKRIHRQSASTGIPQVAAQVRDGVIPELPCFSGHGTGVSFQECPLEAIVSNLTSIVRNLGGFGETQILGVTKNGLAGVKNINNAFHSMLSKDKRKLVGWDFAETDPIMFTVNEYSRELYNGTLGRVIQVCPELNSVGSGEEASPTALLCEFEGRLTNLSGEDLANLELAYAITTHKAQGSQFRRVVVVVTATRLLDRTLLYTALTRGVEQVVFVGDRRAFNSAILRPTSASLRNVGLQI